MIKVINISKEIKIFMIHSQVKNLTYIKKKIKDDFNYCPTIIAVSKTFNQNDIGPLLDYGHLDYGENKVQEAVEKWSKIKKKYPKIQLHMIGKLQTNKVKSAVKLFDYIHSVDSKKLAKKISDEQKKINRNIKIFLQVNIGNENQKSGINTNELEQLAFYCKEINLDLIGLMCIPPVNIDPEISFEKMKNLNKTLGLTELSMGMSSDFLTAIKHQSTFIRIGSSIFGQRY